MQAGLNEELKGLSCVVDTLLVLKVYKQEINQFCVYILESLSHTGDGCKWDCQIKISK